MIPSMTRALPILLVLFCGCYTNVPLSTTPQPGARVHVELTDRGTVDLAQYLGRGVAGVDGRLVQDGDSTLSVSVSQVVLQSGEEQIWKGEKVAIPRDAIASVKGRRLSFWRTGLIGGIVVAAAFIVGSQAGSSSGGGKRGTPPPTGQ